MHACMHPRHPAAAAQPDVACTSDLTCTCCASKSCPCTGTVVPLQRTEASSGHRQPHAGCCMLRHCKCAGGGRAAEVAEATGTAGTGSSRPLAPQLALGSLLAPGLCSDGSHTQCAHPVSLRLQGARQVSCSPPLRPVLQLWSFTRLPRCREAVRCLVSRVKQSCLTRGGLCAAAGVVVPVRQREAGLAEAAAASPTACTHTTRSPGRCTAGGLLAVPAVLAGPHEPCHGGCVRLCLLLPLPFQPPDAVCLLPCHKNTDDAGRCPALVPDSLAVYELSKRRGGCSLLPPFTQGLGCCHSKSRSS